MLSQLRYLLAFVLGLAAFCSSLHAQSGDFTFIVMPDIQNETQYYPQVLDAQTQWIAANKAALNIQAVLGLGDITNNGSDSTQWTNADLAYRKLDDAGIPYLLAIGNHDYDNMAPKTRLTSGYNQWFGVSRYSGHPWYKGNFQSTNENYYGELTINGTKYLFLVLEFVPRDEVLTWADSILTANPDKHVILVTHSYMYSDNTRVDQCDTQDDNRDNDGDEMWSKLVSQHPNVEMVLSGHITNGRGSRRVDLGNSGNLVNQIFANYQTLTNGGNGYLRIMTYHPATNSIDVTTYSPYLNVYMTDAGNQFTTQWHASPVTAKSTTMSGVVHDQATCKVIAGATISVGGVKATTDANGRYSLNLAGGSYDASVTAAGYAGVGKDVILHNGYASDVNFYPAVNSTAPCAPSATQPSVRICSPAAGATVSSPVTISGVANSATQLQYMQLFVDGVGAGKQASTTFSSSVALASGKHSITLRSVDVNNATVSQSEAITVAASAPCTLSSVSPSVTICKPANNAATTSPVTVQAGTTDTNPISYVQLFVDGVGMGKQTGGVLNMTTNLAAGTHRVTVQAQDSTGALFKQTINITVSQ